MTITATPTEAPGPIQGNADCDGDVDFDDVAAILREAAGLPDETGCAQPAAVGPFGAENTRDVDCDGSVTALDALNVLLWLADLDELPKPSGCPGVGEPL